MSLRIDRVMSEKVHVRGILVNFSAKGGASKARFLYLVPFGSFLVSLIFIYFALPAPRNSGLSGWERIFYFIASAYLLSVVISYLMISPYLVKGGLSRGSDRTKSISWRGYEAGAALILVLLLAHIFLYM